MLIYRSLITNW